MQTTPSSPLRRRVPSLRFTLLLLAVSLLVSGLLLTQPWRHKPLPNPTVAHTQPVVAPASAQATRARLKESFGKMPLHFVENRGQVDARVGYYVQGHDKSIYFTPQGLTFVLNGRRNDEVTAHPASYHRAANPQSPIRNPQSPCYALKLDFIGARADVQPEGTTETGAVFSYFKGPQSNWKTGLKSYSEITYRELWPGIDLVYAGTVNRMKYTFVVKPGADPNQIKLAYRGASEVKVNEQGELAVTTPAGGFTDDRPISWQGTGAQQTDVPTTFRLAEQSAIRHPQSAFVYGFAVGEYDRSRELVIDPAMFVYAGFIGGDNDDKGNAIAVDSAGNAYVTGEAFSTETTFPNGSGFGALPGFAQTNGAPGNPEAFVVKVNAAGTALIYATYLGGNKNDFGKGIAVDSAGNAYVTGYTTNGSLFPTLNGPDLTYNGGEDAFVTKLNPAGTALVYSGFIGGDANDHGNAIAVDSAGNAYVTGDTRSTETTFPNGSGFGAVPGFDPTYNGGPDAFVVKVKADGSELTYATYIGGGQEEFGYGIAVDSAGNAYVAGNTFSDEIDFPNGNGFASLPGLPGFDQTQNDGVSNYDAFVVKLNAAGTTLLYGTFLGGNDYDAAYAIAVDSAGNAYVTGETDSLDTSFPNGGGFGALGVPGFNQAVSGGGGDAFVMKLNPAGTALVYGTYLGGSGHDIGYGIAVNSAGNAYVTGEAGAGDFPTLGGPDTTYNGGATDAFVTKLNPAGTALVYASFIGGDNVEIGHGIALDSAGNAYVAGETISTETTFPNGSGFGGLTSFDNTQNSQFDAFVVKIEEPPPPPQFTPPVLTNQAGGRGNNLGANITDPAVCLDPGGLVGNQATVTNPNNVPLAATFTATLPTGLTAVAGTCVADVNPGGCTIAANGGSISWNGNLTAGQTVTIIYRTRLGAAVAQGAQLCIDNAATVGGVAVALQYCFTINCPLTNTRVSDQKAGSVLVFPYYTSVIGGGGDTRLTISNISNAASTVGNQTYVHLFFIDGTTCQQSDLYLCLTPNASFSFKASEYDPGNTGYVIAVAVDNQGRPLNNNVLIGNAFVNTPTFADNYSAESFRANGASAALYTQSGNTATLYFDHVGYDAVPKQFTTEIQSPLDAAGQQVITAGLSGDLTTSSLSGAAQVGTGLAYNEKEVFGSFNGWLTGTCQARGTISTASPRVPNGLGNLIKAGQAGSLKFNVGAAVGLLLTPRTATWKGIRALHKTQTVATTLTIPIFVPVC